MCPISFYGTWQLQFCESHLSVNVSRQHYLKDIYDKLRFPWKCGTYSLQNGHCRQHNPTVHLQTQKMKTTFLQVLKVPWPSNSSYSQLTPSHVVVRRCSGGCHGGLTSCVPTKTDKRKVSVLLARWVWPVVHLVLALDQLRCPLGGGSCQKECATLEVEDELACGCGCRLDPSSCRY